MMMANVLEFFSTGESRAGGGRIFFTQASLSFFFFESFGFVADSHMIMHLWVVHNIWLVVAT